jgi:clan AA aspartic protease (TIGR02281 family)
MRRARRGLVLVFVLLAMCGASLAELDQAGRAAYERADYDAAERAFGEAIARAPADALLRYHRGAALMQLGRWDDAVAEYERVLKLRPTPEVASASRGALETLRPLVRRTPSTRTEGGERPIRLERWHGGWVVKVLVNNSAHARFLVDTGASVTAISPDLADNLGIAPSRPPLVVKLQTLGGETKASVVVIGALAVGDVEAKDVSAVVHDMPAGLDGILGNTYLGRYSVTLNAQQGHLIVRRK